ncbi:DUF1033 family protein [Solibacillus sp. CAU 1738]|uniref:DUF1033 family protein n=1 Tax=Solibacillus sp. CAU 1738 TaxID=3140363 RepID=UPI00326109A1
MYKIIYMKADYEPWWQFEGWEEKIEETYIFDTEEDYETGLQNVITQFREKYEHEEIKKGKYIAFWSKSECEYCEACDDDAQIFHGIILEKNIN